jgi:hypothetical protein
MGIFSTVGFTGGEPLMFANEILALADILKTKSIPFTIATAAHWASTESATNNLVHELHARGLTRVGISSDPSHQAFVPKVNVIRAARAFAAHGVETHVVGAFFDDSTTTESMFPELAEVEGVSFKTHRVCRVGGATKKRLNVSSKATESHIQGLRCYRSIYHDIVVFHDGKTYPCCSVFNRAARDICLGDANVDSLRRLYQRAEGSLLMRALKRQGFGAAYQVAVSHDPTLASALPKLVDAKDACSLCRDIFGNRDLARRVHSAFAEEEVDRIVALVRNIESTLGPSVRDTIIDEVIG